jgi:hypothetical protein
MENTTKIPAGHPSDSTKDDSTKCDSTKGDADATKLGDSSSDENNILAGLWADSSDDEDTLPPLIECKSSDDENDIVAGVLAGRPQFLREAKRLDYLDRSITSELLLPGYLSSANLLVQGLNTWKGLKNTVTSSDA